MKEISREPTAYYRRGFDKYGASIETNNTKARLTETEARFLKLFEKNDEPRPMLHLLVEYQSTFEQEFSVAQASRDLDSLHSIGFLVQNKGRVAVTNRHEMRYRSILKTLYFLSEAAKSGALKTDLNRWVLQDGAYIANESIRQKIEMTERLRQASHSHSRPQPLLFQLLGDKN